MDTVSVKKRSELMSRIKSKGSVIEKQLRTELKKRNYVFKTNVSELPGKPDIVFTKQKFVIFIDSCFWHGCRYHCRLPHTNTLYWKSKIERNKKRDRLISKIYNQKNWKQLRFWEHQIKTDLDKTLKQIEQSYRRR